MSMYNLDKDELICKSCPVYGTEPGAPLPPPLRMFTAACAFQLMQPFTLEGSLSSGSTF